MKNLNQTALTYFLVVALLIGLAAQYKDQLVNLVSRPFQQVSDARLK